MQNLGIVLFVLLMFNCAGKPAVQPDEGIQKQISSQEQRIEVLQAELLKQQSRFDNKLKILEDRTTYSDSLYFEIQAEFESLLARISLLENDLSRVSAEASIPAVSAVKVYNDDDYRSAYIEALAQYQNGNYASALKNFSKLISSDRKHDLADNCQYWVGEINYARKDYRQAIDAFERVFDYPETNKADHAQFKLGLCYLNIGETQKAKAAFVTHITNYPNSELYSRSKEYLEQK